MTYYNEEFDDTLDDVIEYLGKLSNINNYELQKELYDYKKVLDNLNKNCKSEKIKYFICITLLKLLNVVSNSSYKPIIDKLKELKKEISYEKSRVYILKQILMIIKRQSTIEDIYCFYITLTALVRIHNNRFIYSNNVLSIFQTNFKGLTVEMPMEDMAGNIELKTSLEESIKYFTKKIY